MTDHPTTRPSRASRRNGPLLRFVAGHLLAVVTEWAVLIGLLVFVFDRAGSRAAGLASLVALAPYLLLSSAVSRLARRHRPALVRTIALGTGAAGCAAASASAFADGPVWVVVAAVAVVFASVTTLRPAGAAIMPAIVRSSVELTRSNVWIGHCENASVLVGPLSATALLGIGGPGAVMAGGAVLLSLAGATAVLDLAEGPPADANPQPRPTERGARARRALTSPVADAMRVARRPGAGAVLAVETAQYAMLGAFDLVFVVLAGSHLDLGDAGAGVLSSLVGAGAFASGAVANRLVDRPRLAPAMLISMATMAVACVVLGVAVSVLVACVVLPILGAGRALVRVMARVLLQRSAPPSELPMVFGAIETSSGIGMLAGSISAQVLIGVSGPGAALVGIGVLFAALVVLLAGHLPRADEGADVPVVAMSLLKRTPVFEPLPVPELEAVARSAHELPVTPGQTIIRQGDPGDRFYAVADGTFDVHIADRHIRTIHRGGSFGEVALLADTPRTATVTATTPGLLLAIDRAPFLIAVTGHDGSHQAAWGAMHTLHFDEPLPDLG